jgi:hypothetical protein
MYFINYRQTRQPTSGEWKHGLYSCVMPDCACAICFMPCYAYQVAGAAGKEGCSKALHCVFPLLLCCLRAEIRQQHGIEGGCINDLMCLWCCPFCVSVVFKIEIFKGYFVFYFFFN